MGLHLITTKDLKKLKAEIISDLHEFYADYAEKANSDLVTAHKVKKLLNISAGTLREYRLNGTLKAVKKNKLYYFERSEVNQLLEKNSGPLEKT